MTRFFVTVLLILIGPAAAFANGGAWQTGIPGTGSASASNKDKKTTNVTIESELLTIDLHSEFAAVEVHYRMHNSGPKVQQDFFFPIERWGTSEGEEQTKPTDLEHYQIQIDAQDLKWTDVPGAEKETSQIVSGSMWNEKVPVIKGWKKSTIPFEPNQTREVTIRFQAKYSEADESVSDDEHISNATFAYSLSPAATWKGAIGKGQIDINIMHAEPEDVSIEKPKNRFKKITDTHYRWTFDNLKPSLADDIRIVAHSAYDKYPTGYTEEDLHGHNSYVLRAHQYFLDHTDYDATASSTLAPQGDHTYDVSNIKADAQRDLQSPWAEGVEGDGVGETITLDVKRPLPLYGILVRPGYYDSERKELWGQNNRVAALEITLNDEYTFTENIPDEQFAEPYLLRVRNYIKPVKKVKLTIKGVHRGTQAHDTCISLVQLRGALEKKPEVHPAR
jgi:hypothetical protein